MTLRLFPSKMVLLVTGQQKFDNSQCQAVSFKLSYKSFKNPSNAQHLCTELHNRHDGSIIIDLKFQTPWDALHHLHSQPPNERKTISLRCRMFCVSHFSHIDNSVIRRIKSVSRTFERYCCDAWIMFSEQKWTIISAGRSSYIPGCCL